MNTFQILNWNRCLDTSERAGGGRLKRECIDIIRRLICDTEHRLGKKGPSEVKKHPWFKVGEDFFFKPQAKNARTSTSTPSETLQHHISQPSSILRTHRISINLRYVKNSNSNSIKMWLLDYFGFPRNIYFFELLCSLFLKISSLSSRIRAKIKLAIHYTTLLWRETHFALCAWTAETREH